MNPRRPAASRPRIHLTSVGNPPLNDVLRLGVRRPGELRDLVQKAVGEAFEATISPRMLFATEPPDGSGRTDDAERAAEIQRCLADDRVAALVTLRGGAWFTRVLPRIDFEVLRARRRRIFIFGFSEMTTLVAVAGQYPLAVGLYDLGPGFLFTGLRRQAERSLDRLAAGIELPEAQRPGFAAGWAAARFPQAFAGFFSEVADILLGRGSPRVPVGRLRQGRIPPAGEITITGGNLSLILPMLASPCAGAFETRGKWLAIEDIDEDAERIDRMIAALSLAGLLARAEGIILGDFQHDGKDLSETAYRILRRHLPPGSTRPVIALENFGHIHPMAPLPMHRPVTLLRRRASAGQPEVEIRIPWSSWADPPTSAASAPGRSAGGSRRRAP